MYCGRSGYKSYGNPFNKRYSYYYKGNRNPIFQNQRHKRRAYCINHDFNKYRKKRNFFNYNSYDSQSSSCYNDIDFTNYELDNRESDYEEQENQIQDNKVNNKKIEFKEVKESVLKTFYEAHYENLYDKIRKAQSQKDINEACEELTINDIKKKCSEINYMITEHDEDILNNMENEKKTNTVEYYNKYMFYSKIKKSIYVPHILKAKNDITNIYITNKKLNALDFQITDENNHLFYSILLDRLIKINSIEYNKAKTYKKFGITTNEDGSIGILYTTIEEDFLRQFLLNEGLNGNNKLGSVSKNNKISPTDLNIEDINVNFIKGLTNEELILLNIYEKIGQNHITKYPRLLLYESNCFINGEPVLRYITPGYQEVDCIMKSGINITFPSVDTPFYLQKEYQINKTGIEEIDIPSISLTITKDIIYMFEIKSSFPNNIVDIIRKMIKNTVTFRNLFIRENIIEENDKFEIIIIYDSYKSGISSGLSKLIGLNKLYDELEGLKIKIVYCKPIYALCALYTVTTKINELENRIIELEKLLPQKMSNVLIEKQ